MVNKSALAAQDAEGPEKTKPRSYEEQGFALVTDTKRLLSKKFAQELLSYPKTAWERAFKPKRVNRYVLCMQRGRFHFEWVSIVVFIHKGQKFLANAKHTSDAVIHSGITPEHAARYLEYEVDDEASMRELYALIDQNFTRTPRQNIVARCYDLDEFKGISQRHMTTLVEGLRTMLYPGAERTRHLMEDALDELFDQNSGLIDAFTTAYNIIGPFSNQYSFFYKSSVIGAMLKTCQLHPRLAAEFWSGVKEGADLSRDDARLKVRNMLLTTSTKKPNSGAPVRIATHEALYRWCIRGWNAWRTGAIISKWEHPRDGAREDPK